MLYDQLIFERSKKGRKGITLPKWDLEEKPLEDLVPKKFIRTEDTNLPEVSEVDVIRHYTNLSTMNYGVDTGFYPLGSCTMKYNPKINEEVASIGSLANMHPYQDEKTVQGSLELMYDLADMLAEISGMDQVTLQPAAGAHGELTGIMLIKAYHHARGDFKRTKVITPDSSHGTNPATINMAGYEAIEIKSKATGEVDIDALKAALNDEVAGLMLTNPNTLGLFEREIKEIADLVHEAGGLLYYDGANMNAIMSKTRPGDMGFDVMHYNLHKTFSTPHGGGGPGAGPVGVKKKLAKFLPVPVVSKNEEQYFFDYERPDSIGKVKGFYGNYGILVRAYSYIMSMGKSGIKEVSEMAVLNANYMMSQLKEYYKLPIDRICKHEFVLDGLENDQGVTTLDIAKRLLDYGYHPPTIYFPLIVHEALMIEPTETESKDTIDEFIKAMVAIAKEAESTPDLVKNAPNDIPMKRIDEVKAARNLVLKWEK
ncbi:MAG TPA: aminomethyl-transferring glycine dehydrogenase subunit GcvPB [Clostridia bacterium]|nr:aminomethyl-transferring glycine dehydrogenase subunit GcvPB [Clostridia bacterium]